MSLDQYYNDARNNFEITKCFHGNFIRCSETNLPEYPADYDNYPKGFVCKWHFDLNDETIEQAKDAGLPDKLISAMQLRRDKDFLNAFIKAFSSVESDDEDCDFPIITPQLEEMIDNNQIGDAAHLARRYMDNMGASADEILNEEIRQEDDYPENTLIIATGFVRADTNELVCFIDADISNGYTTGENTMSLALQKTDINDCPPFEEMCRNLFDKQDMTNNMSM